MSREWNKKSIKISMVLCIIIYAAIAVFAVGIPFFTKTLLSRGGYSDLTGVVNVLLYLSLPPALIATAFLHKLLININRGEIFCRQNIVILRILAWACFAVGVIYLLFAHHITLCLIVSFAAFFFFMMLRVIKNVFCEALVLKQENDLTV